MSNKLKNENSPYLLQHSENPVDWYPWNQEAFDKAREEDKPVFLSIGYSTCHWCHVMAHESFEDEETAQILNKYFVPVKVDREERPDIDSVYMSVCQAFTGNGGWPMSIFMTWDKKPFFAGTYFPPRGRYGMPGFTDLLITVKDKWTNSRPELLNSARQVISHLKNYKTANPDIENDNLEEMALSLFAGNFDKKYGGFGTAPKFPTAHNILFLLLYSWYYNNKNAQDMALKTLCNMRKGGIFDHIGYGFSRYSTDQYFLVPHFEKMLYDNALLVMAYSAAYCVSGDNLYLDTARKTAKYILREMVSEDGGFYSAQDADSEGMEGKFYTFTLDEIIKVLGKHKGILFAKTYNITANGNFEGVNIPNLLESRDIDSDFSEEIKTLYNYRKKRTKLHLDDKHLASWNSIMAAALSMLYRVSHKNKYLEAARKAQVFIEENLCKDSQMYTSFRNGKHSGNVFLDDYAFYIMALIEIYNSTLETGYLDKAEYFCNETVKRFADNENGGYFLSETGNSELFINPKETYDGAMPSGNSVMAYNLIRLYQLTEKENYNKLAEKQIKFMSLKAGDYPSGYSMFLIAKMIYENPPVHITIVLKSKKDLQEIKEKLPFLANIKIEEESKEYHIVNNRTTYYICKNHVCQPPVNKF